VNEKQAERKRRRHRSRAEAERIAIEYEASGLSREEFCRRNDVAMKSLSRYLAWHRQNAVRQAGRRELIAVEIAKPHCGLEQLAVVLSNGRRIELKGTFDERMLQRLLALLEQS
jgi:hypothetical protein